MICRSVLCSLSLYMTVYVLPASLCGMAKPSFDRASLACSDLDRAALCVLRVGVAEPRRTVSCMEIKLGLFA
jgi:hypothetical protein